MADDAAATLLVKRVEALEAELRELRGHAAIVESDNSRLFNELQERNREVKEALDQQTAMADVLGIIARSPTAVQPVLDAIVQRGSELLDCLDVHIVTIDDDGAITT